MKAISNGNDTLPHTVQGSGSEVIKVKERQHFIDVLRAAAVCAVVLLHTVTGVMDNTDMSQFVTEQKVFFAIRDLVCWCVPVFVMISGYLFLNPARQLTFGQMVTKYCRRVALALLLFGIPYAWVELAVTEGCFRPAMLWQGVVRVLQWRSWSHMWYLYLILCLYLMTPGIRWVLKRMSKPAFYILLAVLFVECSILPFAEKILGNTQLHLWTVTDQFIYLFYYLWGYLASCREKSEKWEFPLSAGMAGVLAVCMTVSRIKGFSLEMAYNYPLTVLLALCIFQAAQAWEKRHSAEEDPIKTKKNTGIYKKAAELSFAVYLIHPIFLNLAYKYLKVTPMSFFVGVSLPLFFLGTLALACAAAWILRKIPVLRKYVL